MHQMLVSGQCYSPSDKRPSASRTRYLLDQRHLCLCQGPHRCIVQVHTASFSKHNIVIPPLHGGKQSENTWGWNSALRTQAGLTEKRQGLQARNFRKRVNVSEVSVIQRDTARHGQHSLHRQVRPAHQLLTHSSHLPQMDLHVYKTQQQPFSSNISASPSNLTLMLHCAQLIKRFHCRVNRKKLNWSLAAE